MPLSLLVYGSSASVFFYFFCNMDPYFKGTYIDKVGSTCLCLLLKYLSQSREVIEFPLNGNVIHYVTF